MDLTFAKIAERLNFAGVMSDLQRLWSSSAVRTVLTNEKYIANHVFNRSSFKLKDSCRQSLHMWTRKEGCCSTCADAGADGLSGYLIYQAGDMPSAAA